MRAVSTERAWERSSEQEMQEFLSGSLTREEYLRDREQQVDLVWSALEFNTDHVVFEIGSGEGVVAARLAPRVRHLTCVNISESFLAKAREACREVSNVDFQLCRGDYLEALPAAGFDRGYSWNLFIHLDAYQVFHYLRGAARILRPGGRFAVNFVSLGDQTRSLFRMFADAYPTAWPEQLPGFLRWYEPELMVAIAGEAGLAPLRHSGEGGSHALTLYRPDADG